MAAWVRLQLAEENTRGDKLRQGKDAFADYAALATEQEHFENVCARHGLAWAEIRANFDILLALTQDAPGD